MVQQNTWQWALDGFKYELELQVKPKTVDYYHSRVKSFAKWASETHGINSPTLVSKRDIQAFLHDLTPHNEPTSRERDINSYRWPYYRALKRYSSWAIHEGILEINPMDGISLRAPRAPIIEPCKPDHVLRLTQALDLEHKQAHTAREKMRSARNTAIVCLFMESGARLSELTNLTINDIDLDNKSIMIRDGKMGKSRQVVLPLRDSSINTPNMHLLF
ncbi:MAG: tyrosine-type recombinase/integrase [Chloroflexi bacterium]|jgi:integrase/recombinase XerD|nr:tyrosine-type recombinase/integrase [Chloroflexota bacterium]MBT7081581.1 tyrosine-type recombinase/integrase [Chloroflexota bacterium]MBT7289083.1 tyrosine-type recombinase/integrase [Chloroflexota bacterium]